MSASEAASQATSQAMIAVDWGTSSFRAWRLDASGTVLDERRAAKGIMACDGQFEATLSELLAGWDEKLVVLGGMIGSRQGWHEVPYVECPAGLAEIAAGMVKVPVAGSRDYWIAPGLRYRAPTGPSDVMRGEEVQICGLVAQLGAGTHTLCLPGTHSKWATLEDGRITSFATAMTGEVFALLKQHSILGRLMQPGADDAAAFLRGVAQAPQAGGLLHHLFSVRTLGLFDELAPTQLASYLSGLLIGSEIAELTPKGEGKVHLVGGASLARLYELALQGLNKPAQLHGDTVGAQALRLLAQARGLVA